MNIFTSMRRSAVTALFVMLAALFIGYSAEANDRNHLSAAQPQSALRSKDAKIRLAALQLHDPKLWKDFAGSLAKDPDAEVRECFAHYYLPDTIFDSNRVELIESFANDPDERVRAAIAGLSITPEPIILRLIAQRRWPINKRAAHNSFRGTHILEAVVAQVPPLPKGQDSFGGDTGELIRGTISNLIQNPVITPEMLRTLYKKGIPYFNARNALYDNQNWPADRVIQFGLDETAGDPPSTVEGKFWKQINTDKSNKGHALVLGLMLGGPIQALREAAVASRFTPVKALDQYYRSGLAAQDGELERLARNAATSKEVRLAMVKKTSASDVGSIFSRLLSISDVEIEVVEAIEKRAANNKTFSDMYLYERDAKEIIRKRTVKK